MSTELSKFENLEDPIIFHITITGKCQGKCKGCINTLVEKDRKRLLSLWEADPFREAKVILELIKFYNLNNGKPIYIAFYGGEPLLELKKIFEIKELLNKYGKFYYILYTNGLLLKNFLKFESEISDFKYLIISIDGREKQHNRVRPGINYKKIYCNLRYFKNKINNISIIMWSTLRENQSFGDCIKAFLELYEENLVDYFFWHFLDTTEPFINFKNFYQNYESDLEYLLEIYLEDLKIGKILPILPLNELIYFNITKKERKSTACKVELMKNFDIVKGKAVPCIDVPSNFHLAKIDEKGKLRFKKPGLIKNFLNNLIKYKTFLGCYNCEAHYYCGGRCPVQALCSIERAKNYCELTKLLVNKVRRWSEEIEPRIKNIVSLEEFYKEWVFPVYFTDVVP